jgi:hypothetical protein
VVVLVVFLVVVMDLVVAALADSAGEALVGVDQVEAGNGKRSAES